MNCRNAFQIEQGCINAFEYLENRMTNRASETVLRRSALYFRKMSRSFSVRLAGFFQCVNQPHQFFRGVSDGDIVMLAPDLFFAR